MSISLITTRGFGNGTLVGDINKVTTSGYSFSEFVLWTKQDPVTTSWSAQAGVSTTWSEQADVNTTWTIQS